MEKNLAPLPPDVTEWSTLFEEAMERWNRRVVGEWRKDIADAGAEVDRWGRAIIAAFDMHLQVHGRHRAEYDEAARKGQ